MRRDQPRWRVVWGVAALLLLPMPPAAAHELGTVRTFVAFRRDGSYRIEVRIDREHLPPGFATSFAPPPHPIRGVPPGEEGSLSGRILAEVARRCEIRFDGRTGSPELSWDRPDPAASELVLALTGEIPGGAREFTWRNSSRLGSYLLTLQMEGEPGARRQWVEGGEPSRPFPLKREFVPPTARDVVRQYLELGFTHILPRGADHILFVLGVFFLSRRWRPILLQVTAFTLAHTLTLGLTIYGVVSLRPAVVEPMIALSIVYVALEDVWTSRLNPWRVALVFGFGLIHGMGFAGVLSQLGLPRSQFLPALVSFNVGVELGQLSVIAAASLAIALPLQGKPWYRRCVVVPLTLGIAGVGLYWAVERTATLWARSG